MTTWPTLRGVSGPVIWFMLASATVLTVVVFTAERRR